MSNSQKLHIPGLMKKMKICKKTIYKYIDRKITMWYSLTCVVSDASNNARVAQWWSVSLPRRRSRVRSPSRAYVFAKRGASTSQTSYEIRGSDLRLLKSPSVGLTGKRSTGPFSYAVSPRLALIFMP